MIVQVQEAPAPPAPPPVPDLAPVPDLPTVIVQSGIGPGEGIVILAGLAVVVLLCWPLVRAFARRLEGRGGADRAELDELRQRVADLELQQARMAELEERVDFAERLLAQRTEPSAVRGAQG